MSFNGSRHFFICKAFYKQIKNFSDKNILFGKASALIWIGILELAVLSIIVQWLTEKDTIKKNDYGEDIVDRAYRSSNIFKQKLIMGYHNPIVLDVRNYI